MSISLLSVHHLRSLIRSTFGHINLLSLTAIVTDILKFREIFLSTSHEDMTDYGGESV